MKTFVVLGMHRSATSLVSKGLANEIDMGATFQPARDNPHGHWENWDIVNINDEILFHAGGSWDNPPSKENIIKAVETNTILKNSIIVMCNKFNSRGEYWGFKDPRTCLTIECWLPYLINPHFICVFREPIEVAKSLRNRNGFSIDKGLMLCHIYNKEIYNFISNYHIKDRQNNGQ